MGKAYKVPAIIDTPMSFCPGCGHGIVIRLIAEVLEELGQDNSVIFGIGVGCSSLLGGGLKTDRLHCPHGRASAVCTAFKRVQPENMVIAYQGDGDAFSIGLSETMNAAYRNERFTMFAINNTVYGMTGGQMSTTTMPGQKTSTSPKGRDSATTGLPMHFPELVANEFQVSYAARGTVISPSHIRKLKGYIKTALEVQLSNEGYSVVEILSPCPTNWGLNPIESMKRIEEELIPCYPLGEFKKWEKK